MKRLSSQRQPRRTGRTLTWMVRHGPGPDDGSAPPFSDYDTGRPTKGAKVEFGGDE